MDTMTEMADLNVTLESCKFKFHCHIAGHEAAIVQLAQGIDTMYYRAFDMLGMVGRRRIGPTRWQSSMETAQHAWHGARRLPIRNR
jgi:hypothetical protein